MSNRGRPTNRSKRYKRGEVPATSFECQLAHRVHAGQTRKHDGITPYVEHCKDVAGILKRYGAPAWLVAAGWLHDSVEDCKPVMSSPVLAMLVDDMRTHKAVMDVTNMFTREAFPEWNRARRKQAESTRLGGCDSFARWLKAADILSNLSMHGGIVDSMGTAFGRLYLTEKRATIAAITAPGGIPTGLTEAVRRAHERESAKL